MDEAYRISRFDGAVLLLPQTLRCRARQLSSKQRGMAEEVRLRVGQPMTVLAGGTEIPLGAENVVPRDLESVLEIGTQASMHSVRDSLRRGFVTLRGGYRLGLCGTAVTEHGQMTGLRCLSSAALRISREIRGAAESVLPYVVHNGKFSSTLILSPPGMGKTTLLRDMVRLLSDRYRFRVAVADERGEIAAMYEGRPGMDVGRRTDVLEGCGKAEGTMTLLRAMNPEIIAMDEITEMRDLEAIRQASYCGVKLLATVHAENREGLIRRPLYRELLALEVFSRFVTVENHAGERRYTVTDEEGALCCG